MNVNSTTDTSSSQSVFQNTGSSNLGADAFMKLLVTQMKNQDPMSPVDNQQQIAQLAQFSTLSEMQELNDNVVGLAVLQQNNALLEQLTQSSALIGKEVQWLDPQTQETKVGTVGSIKLQDGLALLSVDGVDVPLASVTAVNGTPAADGADTTDGSDEAGN